MEALTAAAKAEAERVIASLPERVASLDALVTELFPLGSPSAAAAQFKASVDVASGAPNVACAAALSRVQDEVAASTTQLAAIARWISLSVPKIEDGGNWGVQVQDHVLKLIRESIKAQREVLKQSSDYHEQRATGLQKFVNDTHKESMTSKSTSTSKGGKEGDEAKEVESVVTKESTKESTPLADSVDHVAALDAKWYFTAKGWLEDVRDSLAVVCDTVQKNMDKVSDPKQSSGGGGGASSMSYY